MPYGYTRDTGGVTGHEYINKPITMTEKLSLASRSYQMVAADLTLLAAAGSNDASAPKRLAPFMGNVLDDSAALTKAANTIGGVIGAYTVTVANSSTYPVGAVLAEIGDGVTDTSNVSAFVAYIDGDSGAVNCEAMFKVKCNNSTAASGPDFGLDLQDAAHDSYIAVDSAFYKKAPIRIAEDIVILTGTATPTDGTSGTGAGNAGPGSLHLNTSDGKLRTNTNTKASPTWTVVGAQTA